MPTLLLVRHGLSTANAAGLLAGRTPGVRLNEHGAAQAAALPGRLAGVPLAVAVHSPQQRCKESLAPLAAARPELSVQVDERISECDYGEWSGRKLAELADEALMTTVQQQPSAAAFPGGESLRAMQHRAVQAARDWNDRVERDHGAQACFLMCSHGDIIKSVIADALGLHLDLFQRIAVDPGSVSVLRYTRQRPYLLRLGDTGDLGGLAPREGDSGDDATVGGGAGAP